METLVGGMEPFGGWFRGRRVWVSGHTGFKGSWLCEWLLSLGARVFGYSIEPPSEPNLFSQLDLAHRIESHQRSDVMDAAEVMASIGSAAPEIIFHLAAQPLVLRSYAAPAATWSVNVFGTIHVLEAVRQIGSPVTLVVVTSDKCYENGDKANAYAENDPLGGFDPYSSSKAAAEIAVASWRRSFWKGGAIQALTVRAGNVIGGGDWAENRIIPDCIRSIQGGVPLLVRRRNAIRPWQHVLDPIAGYLCAGCFAATGRWRPREPVAAASCAFNFGPGAGAVRTVGDLLAQMQTKLEFRWTEAASPSAPHEAAALSLDTAKGERELGWRSIWGFEPSVDATAVWYDAYLRGANPGSITRLQLEAFIEDAKQAGAVWLSRP